MRQLPPSYAPANSAPHPLSAVLQAPAARALLERGPTAWPTVMLAVTVWVAFLAVGLALAGGALSPLVALPLQAALAFAAFTPAHDATHDAVSRHRWLNDGIGWLCASILIVPFAGFRVIHLAHHRDTNDPARDPDMWSGRGRGPTRLARWATQDLHYISWYARRAAVRPRAEVWQTAVGLAVMVGVVAGLVAAGHGAAVLWGWLVPTRLAIVALAITFDYLPHQPYHVLGRSDPLRATAVIEHRWLTPVLLGQNYHLAHHLFPGVPFYQYARVWWGLRDELMARGALVRYLRPGWPALAERPADGAARPLAVPPTAVALEVTEVVWETPDTLSLWLMPPAEAATAFAFEAGQFLTVAVTLDGEPLRRCYSLSRAPAADGRLRITVHRLPGGRVSGWVHGHARPGLMLVCSPPAGRFTLRAASGAGPLLLVAAGSGVTPIVALAQQAIAATGRPVRVLQVCRRRADAILIADLGALVEAAGGRLALTLWETGGQGRPDALAVQAWASAAAGDEALGSDAYICGPDAFRAVVREGLVAAGVPIARQHVESFGPAAGAASGLSANAPAAKVRLVLDGTEHEVLLAPGETVLAGARRAGLAPPASCEAGYCGSCAARTLAGSVAMVACDALAPEAVAAGWVLACQSYAQQAEGVVISWESPPASTG